MSTARRLLAAGRLVLAQAARSLWRSPRGALLAVGVLAGGLGVATGTLAIARGLLLRGLPFPEADRLVAVSVESKADPELRQPPTAGEVLAWREEQSSLETLVPFAAWYSYLRWPDGEAEARVSATVDPGLFDLLRVAPRFGRPLLATDCGGPPVALVSEEIWEQRFARQDAILGAGVAINRRLHSIVGVMPKGFGFPYRQDVWVPLCLGAGIDRTALAPRLFTVGRLRPGVSLAAARADLRRIAASWAAEVSAAEPSAPRLEPYLAAVTSPGLHRSLAVVGAGALGLLVVSGLTAALLLLLDTMAERRRLAVEMALGASAGRVVALVGARAALLSAAGCGLGFGLASFLTAAFRRLSAPEATLRGFWVDLHLDAVTVGWAVLAAGLLVPATAALAAWRASRISPQRALGRAAGTARGGELGWPRSLLIVAQVALAAGLLAGAGLTLRSVWWLAQTSYGFDPRPLLTARLSAYAATEARPAQLYETALEALQSDAAVAAAVVMTALPAGASARLGVLLPGEPPSHDPASPQRSVLAVATSPGLTATLDLPLLAGRDLRVTDSAAAPAVVLVSRSFARRHFGDGRAVGQRLGVELPGEAAPRWAEIVGVVADLAWAEEVAPADAEVILLPLAQPSGLAGTSVQLLVRGHGRSVPSAALEQSVREAVRRAAPGLALWDAEPLRRNLGRAAWSLRAFCGLFTVFGVLASVLACASLYGVVALALRSRRQALAVHLALGAGRGELLRQAVGSTARELTLGLALGSLAALEIGRRWEALLRLPGSDRAWALTAVAVLAVPAVLALVLPLVRALRTAPTALLRDGGEGGG